MDRTSESSADTATADRLEEKLKDSLRRLAEARPFAKARYQQQVLDLARRLAHQPAGIPRLYGYAAALDEAGIFAGTDWDQPQVLLPRLVRHTLESGKPQTVTLELVNQLRFLAIAEGHHRHVGVSIEGAKHFLTQVLALNLDQILQVAASESQRKLSTETVDSLARLFQFVLSHIGLAGILERLVAEIERILAQRPLQVGPIKAMVTQVAVALHQNPAIAGEALTTAERLVRSLFGPTIGSEDDPGLIGYRLRLDRMTTSELSAEARSYARSMHNVGLVSDYHAVFLRWLLENDYPDLIPIGLGLSSTGLDVLRTYQSLVHRLIHEAVHPQTAQCVYGLALLLERGLLYSPPIAPACWRQINLRLTDYSKTVLETVFGPELQPRVHLLAGVISLLGQPLGIGQGNNPICQSARAISMWAHNDPDFLLHLISQVTRYDELLMHFEGQPIRSSELVGGLISGTPLDTDPVSTVLVPHLDRIYHEMGRLCAGRGEDPHRWINPEFHGWWVGRDFLIAVDVSTGLLKNYEAFVSRFYRSCHPFYNGNQPIIHPQPAGLAVTDGSARFVGWHAITVIRVALDQRGVMRVYFYNPNNDSGQDWGHGVQVSASGNGERFGEASLPFPQLASRLYIFHDDPLERRLETVLPPEEIAEVQAMGIASWAATRVPQCEAGTGTA